MTFTYDEAGNVVTRTDRLGRTTHYTYDELNRLILTEFLTDDNMVSYTYNAYGDLTGLGSYTGGFENGLGDWVNVSGDDMDWTLRSGSTPSSGTGPSGAHTGAYYIYTEASSPNYPSKTAILEGPAFEFQPQTQPMLAFRYHMYGTAMGTLYVEISEDGQSWTPIWSLSGNQGNVWQEANVDLSPYCGTELTIRLRGVTGSSYTSDMAIDDIKVIHAVNVYSYTYDDMHRMTGKTDKRLNKSLLWEYDPVGNVTRKTDYQGEITSYVYDSTNRLVSLRNQAYLQVSYHYDPAGRLLDRILSNRAKTSYTYDNDNRLFSLTNTSAGDKFSQAITYTHDNIGNIATITDASGTVNFTYDAVYRLTNANYPGTADDVSYTYDGVGNRLTMTDSSGTLHYKYNNDGNRLDEVRQGSDTGPVVYRYVYDDTGNRIEKRNGADMLLQSYTYDQKNRITSLTTQTETYSFEYDPNDYRIEKSDSTDSRKYLLEGEHYEAVYDESNDLIAKYLRGVVVDEIVNGYYYDEQGKKTNYTFHHDHLQSVVGLSGHNGDEEETAKFGPFGEMISSSGTSPNTLKYTGRELDFETGLYYYRARYYDPEIGRFLSEDPLGFEAGVNFYAYCSNNPINFNDPMGLERGDWYDVRSYTDPLLWDTVWQDVKSGGAGQRAIDAFKAELGIMAGSAQLTYAYATKGLFGASVGAHGAGNYLGSIGELSNIIYGGSRDWNYTRQGYEAVSETLTGQSEYGTAAFYSVDLAMGVTMALEPVSISDKVSVLGGVELERFRTVPAIAAEAAPVLAHDILQLGISVNSAIESWTNTSASGGYVLYPNKPNTNMMQNIYKK